jgi:hypothetical protein
MHSVEFISLQEVENYGLLKDQGCKATKKPEVNGDSSQVHLC